MLIDASALSAYVLKEEGWEKARDYLLQGVFSTRLVLKETLNAILMAARREIISNKQAEKCVKALIKLWKSNIKIVEQEDMLEEAFKIAVKNNLTIYDAVYIALSRKLKTTLITRDRRQAESARNEGISVVEL